ncbi:hypothetical protein [Sutcliffiella sp. FSL R7-0096]|uniref:hypothetical protein n=2 Tax=unclassified Sutcliffiella TaxID=2837532 RepID=UPI00315B08FB
MGYLLVRCKNYKEAKKNAIGGTVMEICPLCNGFENYTGLCASCGSVMIDTGKVTDYLDDYSAYMEINLLKLVDGDLNSLENHVCVHLISCAVCQNEQIISIQD